MKKSKLIPLLSSSVKAGFPSPAEDTVEAKLDLNKYLIAHPEATFFVRASGDSMINAGIHSGDILIIDRSLEPTDGKVVIAAIDGELTVKRLHKKGSTLSLEAANPKYQAIEISKEAGLHIWGVVVWVIHEIKPHSPL